MAFWRRTEAERSVAPPLAEVPPARRDRSLIPPPGAPPATPDQKLHALAIRCGVPPAYRSLLTSLELSSQDIDLVIANEIDAEPTLISVSDAGVTLVYGPPDFGYRRTEVIQLPFNRITSAYLLKDRDGDRRGWLIIEAGATFSIPLSTRANEAASHVKHVIRTRMASARPKVQQTA